MSSPTPALPLPGKPDDNGATIMLAGSNKEVGRNEAAELIRGKISNIYSKEPNANSEISEAEEPGTHSQHQQYLLELHNSGLSMEDIQVKWHEYYQGLPDHQKHEVWQEFYSNQNRHNQRLASLASETPAINLPEVKRGRKKRQSPKPSSQADNFVQNEATSWDKLKTRNKRKLTLKQHIKSLMFGLGAGLVVLFLLMFTFFNERYIIPFVKPNQISASTPIITVPGAAVSSDPKVIIPKLNVEAPVVYNVPFIETGETEADFESRVQKALENGVVYYPTSQKPGETGKGFNSNVAIVGHSSNNLFSSGKYKFAFMQIGQLEPGDTFMLNYNSKQYVYKVYEKKVVKPTDVTVLGPASRPNSATLITCDPPGFNINRMVIIGEQISPSPKKNTLTNKQTETPENLIVPSNPKTMWERFWGWVSGD